MRIWILSDRKRGEQDAAKDEPGPHLQRVAGARVYGAEPGGGAGGDKGDAGGRGVGGERVWIWSLAWLTCWS